MTKDLVGLNSNFREMVETVYLKSEKESGDVGIDGLDRVIHFVNM